MTEKTLEERVKDLEKISHLHVNTDNPENPNPRVIIDNHDCNPDDATRVRNKIAAEIREKQPITNEDVSKAAKRGLFYGDPIFITE